jgi:MFS family permease
MTRKNLFKGITRNVFALGIVSTLTDVSSEMIYPLLPLFLTSVLGAPIAFVGLVEGVAESTASLLKLFSGWLSDKLKRRKGIVVLGYSLSTITRPLVALATAGWHVLLVRFVDRVGKGIRTAPRDALIADSTDIANRGKAFGFQRAMDHLGAVIGPLIASLLLYSLHSPYPLRTIFLCAFIPGILAVLVLALFVREQKQKDQQSMPAYKFSLKGLDGRFRFFLLIVILFTLGNSSDAFLILRAKNAGVPVIYIPLLWAFLHVVKSISSTPFGALSDKIGRGRLIVAGWLIYAGVYSGFAYVTSAWQVWFLMGVYGFYFGCTEGVEKALVADFIRPELRGTGYGVYNFAIGLMALPASLIMGILWQALGVKIAFLFGAGLSIIAALLFVILIGLQHNHKNTTL